MGTRAAALALLALLAACSPAPQTALRLVTIDSPDAGLSLRELPPATLKSLGLPFGLAVVRAGSLARRAGLKVGDVVYGVDQSRAKSLEEFNRLLARQGGASLGLLVRRGESDFYVSLDPAAPPPREGMPKAVPPVRDTLLRT